MSPSLQFLVAEDHSIVRMGINLLIREMYPSASVTESATFTAAVQELQKRSFDLLILDINIPGGGSATMIEAARLRAPHLPILIFSSYEEKVHALRYMKAGANGYVHKESPPETIKIAIQKILNNESYVSETVKEQLLQKLIDPSAAVNELSELSQRELEVMQLLVKGYSSSQIKQTLHLQLSTISTYKARIFDKLKVSNVIELAEKIKQLS
ncbi:response regulator transcription factor [Terrimonas sp. NA20]|uniref:Response regulator transcription factor n=1 Tax=Terrimonas ginsenosidimutans TaxID=2908004 RepID=A0ABS9KMJ1_9BACT|nr:response regulator transcription factor [Terrimonas ginsenosidimutans]MCG2613542.1 response regulator transcription factor [Terrimonas ginsenosidimutans]